MSDDLSTKSIEELEAEAREAEAKLAALLAKKSKKKVAASKARPRPKDGEILRKIQQDQTVKNAKSMHGGYWGKTLINKIEDAMDKRRKIMQDMVEKHGMEMCVVSTVYTTNKGRVEGMAAALAILRSSSLREELDRCEERYNTPKEATDGVGA